MVRAKLQGVNTVRKRLADGAVRLYYYHRATGLRLEGKPGSPEFLRAYADAEKAMKDRHDGTVIGLIRSFILSDEFAKRAESTQREYRRMLTKIEAEFGDMPLAALEDARVRQDFMAWRATVARESGEREADHRLSVVSAMLTWAKDHGKVFANHVIGFKRLYSADRSELIWLPEHIRAFMGAAPVELQSALILALHTGQRQGDLLRLTWSNYDGCTLALRQGKTGRKVEIPCTTALRATLASLDRSAAVILTTKTGRPWKPRYFKAQWEAATKAAGITGLHFHDLRGTAVTMLSEAGCTTPQIAAITGHSLKTASAILDRYLARTSVLAGEGITLFENAKTTAFANQLQTAAQSGRKDDAK